jgi:hypothetical protein
MFLSRNSGPQGVFYGLATLKEIAMSRRPQSTYLTAEELKQIAAVKFDEAAAVAPGFERQKILMSARAYRTLSEMKRYLASKELEPPT